MTDNQWGTPDWRDASSYGDVEKWSRARWRWEFLRRRDDVREYFDKWASDTHRRELGANKGLSPDCPGFIAMAEGERRPDIERRFGLLGLPNPRIGPQPESVIETIEDRDPTFRAAWTEGEDNRWIGGWRTRRGRGILSSDDWCGVYLKSTEIAVKFDLDAPIASQIREARELLEHLQRQRLSKPAIKREQPAKWPTYLRVLDAQEAGATLAEMSEILPKSMGNRSPKAAANVLRQAQNVRSGCCP